MQSVPSNRPFCEDSKYPLLPGHHSFLSLPAHAVPAVILCLLPYFPAKLWQIGLISLAITIQQLEFTGGFYYSPSDLAGQFAGVIFGMTNTMAQVSGFMGPLTIAYLAPNVR